MSAQGLKRHGPLRTHPSIVDPESNQRDFKSRNEALINGSILGLTRRWLGYMNNMEGPNQQV
jgi:hypothetical protein